MLQHREQRSYDRISEQRRDELIRQVEIYHVKLKQAARSQGIKYQTAKVILQRYRREKPNSIAFKPIDLAEYCQPISRRLHKFSDFFASIPENGFRVTDDSDELRKLCPVEFYDEYHEIQYKVCKRYHQPSERRFRLLKLPKQFHAPLDTEQLIRMAIEEAS